MRVAFLGTGIMGRPMARHLAQAGHELTVWNRSPEKAQIEGTKPAASAAQAVADAEVIWLCLSDTAAVEQVLFSSGVHGAAQAGAIVADSSTIAPRRSREFAEAFAARGISYVDCPVTGSRIGAENAQLIFIAGGPTEAVQRLDPLFNAMGKRVFHVGGHGMGLATKLAMNLNIALIFEGLAEGLILAEKSGVRAHQLLEIIGSTMLRSGVSDYKAPFLERHDFSPNFPLRLMLKDIHLMLEHARDLRLKLPALETVEEVYAVANEEGLGDLDYAATLQLLEKWAGIPDGGGHLSQAAD